MTDKPQTPEAWMNPKTIIGALSLTGLMTLWNAFATFEKKAAQPSASSSFEEIPVPVSETHISDVKKTINGSVTTLEGIYQGQRIRVRIFGESDANLT
jgi:hypothetical protein